MKYLFTFFIVTSFTLIANTGSNNRKHKNVIDEDETNLSVLTLNTWGLPIWYGKSTDKYRYEKLIDAVSETNADIVCLQETFHPKIREYISTLIDQSYYSHTDVYCNRYSNKIIKMDCFGGLITMSKFPIVSEKFHQYPMNKKYSLIEETGRKGFLVTTLNIKGDYVNVVNTHLYSGSSNKCEDQRLIQARYMDSILVNTIEYSQYPILLAGDMNFQHPTATFLNNEKDSSIVYSFLHECKTWVEGEISFDDNDYTYDNKYNLYASKKERRQKLDYIFWKNLTNEITPIEGEVLYTKEKSVSDHNGYKFEFNLKNSNQNIKDDQLLTQKF